ncbi:MAG TPA: HsdR family type I site-specific deoxyribonuclease [Chloroflexia bacterium]
MSERSAVQNPMLKYAEEIGWQRVKPDEALQMRGGDTEMFFSGDLEAQLLRLNPGVVDTGRAAEIISELRGLRPTIEGNRQMLEWLRGEKSVFVSSEKRYRNVRLIDFDNPDNNIFHVTDEWRHKGARYPNRADVVFLINGIPVALAEAKAATRRDGLAEGIDQVRRYHRETPEMLLAPQVFEVTQLHDFYYGATWNTSFKNLFNWKEEESGNYERKVKAFFGRPRFLKVLHDYIIFLTRDDELTKVILRQHQTRAVEKVVERVMEGTKRRGLVWHTQGSGKTLTMITIAAKLLSEGSGKEKPTVLMLVDRNELEAQLFKNITAYGISNVTVAEGKRDLQQILASDYRGLLVSMVHKFDDIPAGINTRDSIIVLVDEAHRTTGGDLGNYLMAALPNAIYIGFTGTPVDNISKGKGTFKVFGGDDERGYLDKYSIAEAIEDGTTVQLNYALAPSDMRVDRETLEREFLTLADAEGVSDIEDLNAILDRAVELKEMMKAPGRVDRIAAAVAKHFRENVEPMGFKAFMVAVDREACALYKKALDRYLPPEYSEVVYSPNHNDSVALKEHHITTEREKDIRKAFSRKGGVPKILIVTEKLLTGFDAPILYCMYLDKPMRDHVLLQAIARVNRPYEDEEGQTKPYGFVMDFVGIFETLERALAFDSDVVTSVIQNIDVLKDRFALLMREQAGEYLPLTKGWDDKAKEGAIDYFAEKKKRQEFFRVLRQIQNLYDILSPDAFLRPYIEDYQALAELYGLIRNAYSPRPYVDTELTAKTRDLLHQHTGSSMELPGTIHQLGAKELEALRQSGVADTTKVLNLRKILAVTVAADGASKPFLHSIGERAETLAALYEDRQLTTQQALVEFEKLAQEAVEAESQRQTLDVDENTFAIYTVLRPLANGSSVEQARSINQLFTLHPDYVWNEEQKRMLRAKLYKVLQPMVGSDKMIAVAHTLIRLQRV